MSSGGAKLVLRAAGAKLVLRPSTRAFSTWRGPQQVILNYQEPPPPGKRNGRYINQPDKGDAVDIAKNYETTMRDGRELSPPATLETMGFALVPAPSGVADFRDDDEVHTPRPAHRERPVLRDPRVHSQTRA